MHFLTKKVQKGLHILFVYHIIDTLTHKQKAVKWKVVGTRIAVVYVKGFSMEQVYDKIIGERRHFKNGKRSYQNSFKGI